MARGRKLAEKCSRSWLQEKQNIKVTLCTASYYAEVFCRLLFFLIMTVATAYRICQRCIYASLLKKLRIYVVG